MRNNIQWILHKRPERLSFKLYNSLLQVAIYIALLGMHVVIKRIKYKLKAKFI